MRVALYKCMFGMLSSLNHTLSRSLQYTLNRNRITSIEMKWRKMQICICIAFCCTVFVNCITVAFTYVYCIVLYCIVLYCIVLYCIVYLHLYNTSCSAHQSEALPVRETQREESSLERTKRGTWLTS